MIHKADSQGYYRETEKKWNSSRPVHNRVDSEFFDDCVQEVRRSISLQPGCKILDIGCGTGEMLQKFKEMGFLVYGFDFALQKIQEAISLNPTLPVWKQSFLESMGTARYDLVMSFGVIQFCLPTDLKLLFYNCMQATNKNGKVAHFSVPVIEKIEKANGVYFRCSGLRAMSQIRHQIIQANMNSKSVFEDGTFFHSLSKMREIVRDLGGKLRVVDEDHQSYRVNICIEHELEGDYSVGESVSYF